MSNKLDLSGEGKASDFEIKNASEEIFNILRIFDSPKDAASAFLLSYMKFVSAVFSPEYKKEALDSVDTATRLIKEFINEGYQ
jgi:hypothetical protein